MERELADSIAEHVFRRTLGAWSQRTLEIAGKPVEIRTTDLTEETAREPARKHFLFGIQATCTWPSGNVSLYARLVRHSRGFLELIVSIGPKGKTLLYTDPTKPLLHAGDDEVVSITANAALRGKNRTPQHRAAKRAATKKLKHMLRGAGIPMSSQSLELCRVSVADQEVLPSAEACLDRLFLIALHKLDFFSRNPDRKAERGTPLIDVPEIQGLATIQEEDEETDEETQQHSYWALRFREQEIPTGSMTWAPDLEPGDPDPVAQATWDLLREPVPGDQAVLFSLVEDDEPVLLGTSTIESVDADAGQIHLAAVSAFRTAPEVQQEAWSLDWTRHLQQIQTEGILRALFPDETIGGDADEDSGAALPLNLILYGPPGTGKTYQVREDFLRYFRRPEVHEPAQIDLDMLESSTWYEVIAASLYDLGKPSSVTELAEHPWIRTKRARQPFRAPLRSRLWGILQSHTIQESTTVSTKTRQEPLVFDKSNDEDGGRRWFFPSGAPEEIQELASQFRDVVAGPPRYEFLTFHQSYGYEEFLEGIRPRTDEDPEGDAGLRYVLEDGLFLRAVRRAVELTGFEGSLHEFCTDLKHKDRVRYLKDAPRFAVVIDEINRGNVSRILGELITLLEPTRRLGAKEELIVTLPGSRTRFGVPSNLHVIGTMNTADRSIEALDTALRRRFAFQECPPRPELLRDVLVEGGIRPEKLLRRINQRILKLLDRDHLIGHAYFMPLAGDPSFDHLRRIFQNGVIPLLQEYFYGDWGRIGLVLGKAFVRVHEVSTAVLAPFDHPDRDVLDGRVTYELADLDEVTDQDFRSIYEEPRADDPGPGA